MARTLLLLLALPVLGCAPSWSDALEGLDDPGALSGVWGSAPDDVWAVGGPTLDAAAILHYDGSAWSQAEAPAVGLLSWVVGWGPDAALAVGVDGAAARWDGEAWTALDPGTDADLWGVWGASADDVWIVGGVVGADAPTILHFDGATFEPYALPEEDNPRGIGQLFKVWGTGSTVFAVGEAGAILQLQGGAWKPVGAGPMADQDFVSLWGTAEDHMVAVGGRGNARIATWDGAAWDTLAPTGAGGLNAVTMVEEDLAIVGGVSQFVGTFQPSTGELLREEGPSSGGGQDVHATWYDGEGVVWAVGGHLTTPLTGLLWKREEP